MKDTKGITDRTGVSNGNQLNTTHDRSVSRQSTSIEKSKDSLAQTKKTFTLVPPNGFADSSSFRGPFGISTASSIVWYLCICILFIIAFLALVLSVFYFITSTSTEQVLIIYGICGSSSIAITTFVIVFLDCCHDGGVQNYEEVTIYKVFQTEEAKEKPKAIAIQHQQRQKTLSEPHIHPHPYHHRHRYHRHPYHLHAYPPTAYHHPFACSICHDLHLSGTGRHHLVDVAIDTSDRYEPVPKKNRTVHKSTRDTQTNPKLWDTERGTQTDRAEGTQTTAMELSGIPENATEIIYETTVIKAPRSLMSTIKKSMAQQDKDVTITGLEEDSIC